MSAEREGLKPIFASLASSAFLIYLDPQHGTNSVRTLVVSQMLAASAGLLLYLSLGPGYLSGGGAMLVTIALMILLDACTRPRSRPRSASPSAPGTRATCSSSGRPSPSRPPSSRCKGSPCGRSPTPTNAESEECTALKTNRGGPTT
jgi:hypothetical protein